VNVGNPTCKIDSSIPSILASTLRQTDPIEPRIPAKNEKPALQQSQQNNIALEQAGRSEKMQKDPIHGSKRAANNKDRI
jgi:hypothetical protein